MDKKSFENWLNERIETLRKIKKEDKANYTELKKKYEPIKNRHDVVTVFNNLVEYEREQKKQISRLKKILAYEQKAVK